MINDLYADICRRILQKDPKAWKDNKINLHHVQSEADLFRQAVLEGISYKIYSRAMYLGKLLVPLFKNCSLVTDGDLQLIQYIGDSEDEYSLVEEGVLELSDIADRRATIVIEQDAELDYQTLTLDDLLALNVQQPLSYEKTDKKGNTQLSMF
jgi:hypothetical protein